MPKVSEPANIRNLKLIQDQIIRCQRCPRLRAYCRSIGQTKRAAYRDWDYWTRPIPSFGDPLARLVIVGLAPAAHGANRTGRVFTGDRSGDFLFAALHRMQYANQPMSTHPDDGLTLTDCYITISARCAPPDNKPLPDELANCRPYMQRELELLPRARVLLALGKIAWDAALVALDATSRPKFAHAAEATLGRFTLIGSYHVSQQNTFTGKLTEAMFDAVLARCRELSGQR